MDREDLLAPPQVGHVHGHLTIEASGAEQSGVENIRAVGGRDDDHSRVALEAVHLGKELVEGLLALVVAAAHAGPAGSPDGIDLVDEDDGGALLARLRKQVAHAGRAHTHKHLHEVGPADGQERHASLTCNSLGQQRLSRARGTHEKGSLRHLSSQLLVLPGALQKLHKLHHFRLGLITPRHILEHDLRFGVFIQSAHGRFTHAEDTFRSAHASAGPSSHPAHLAPREPDPSRDKQEGRREAHELLLKAHLGGVHDRKVVAWIDAEDVLGLFHLALERVHTADVEKKLVRRLAGGIRHTAHFASGTTGADVHLGDRLVQNLDFLNHARLEEFVLELLETYFLRLRAIH
mmetsp:Transcript_3734/g.6380  ORF Transcript_3734/g.6380 Transcript_3734/m.6380 type:complete len:348 (-) Transcript_3734:659-1702(-)